MPSIQPIKELETELDEAKNLIEQYERNIIRLTKELNDARLEAMPIMPMEERYMPDGKILQVG